MATNISNGSNSVNATSGSRKAPRPAAPNGRLAGGAPAPTPPAPVPPVTPPVSTEAASPAPAPAPVQEQKKEYKRKVCEISRQQFEENALPVAALVDGKAVDIEVKQFSTGSFGWYFSGKITINVTLEDGTVVRVPCQAGLTLTVVGSKELPQ